jgi:hypothetical protein
MAERVSGGRFAKGQSGNPGGRPRSGKSLASLLREAGTPEKRAELVARIWDDALGVRKVHPTVKTHARDVILDACNAVLDMPPPAPGATQEERLANAVDAVRRMAADGSDTTGALAVLRAEQLAAQTLEHGQDKSAGGDTYIIQIGGKPPPDQPGPDAPPKPPAPDHG